LGENVEQPSAEERGDSSIQQVLALHLKSIHGNITQWWYETTQQERCRKNWMNFSISGTFTEKPIS